MVHYASNEPANQAGGPQAAGKEGVPVNGILNDQSLIYRQIAQLLEDGILRGEYCENEQVPSTNELARVFAINPATAAKGVNRLVDEGLLYKRRGIGMFVAPGAAAALRQRRREEFAAGTVEALVREAQSLGLTTEELLALVERKAREAAPQEEKEDVP